MPPRIGWPRPRRHDRRATTSRVRAGPLARVADAPTATSASSAKAADHEAIAGVVRTFFAAFTSGPDMPPASTLFARSFCPRR